MDPNGGKDNPFVISQIPGLTSGPASHVDMATGFRWTDMLNGGQLALDLDLDRILSTTTDMLKYSDYASGILGGTQIGMLEYRQNLSVNSKIGSFTNFRIGYGAVGFASRALGKAGAIGAIGGAILDYRSMQSGEISSTRFAYRLTGAASSIIGGAVLGTQVGGPYGALGGTLIGSSFFAGEAAYDGITWFGNELGRGMTQTENALKGGWYPGR